MEDGVSQPRAGQVICPQCGAATDATGDETQPVACPACGTQFYSSVEAAERAAQERTASTGAEVIPTQDAELPWAIDYRPAETDIDSELCPPEEDELSSLRIRQLSSLRRGALRARSYCIIGALALLAIDVQVVLVTLHHVHDPHHRAGWIGMGTLCAIACVAGAIFFSRRAMALNRELHETRLVDPTEPPDFSTLSDGSQHWKNLERM